MAIIKTVTRDLKSTLGKYKMVAQKLHQTCFVKFSPKFSIFLFLVISCIGFQLCTFNILLSQWVWQTSGTSNHLYDVYFLNRDTGWACGNNGTILKTTNEGTNWFNQTSGISQPLNSVFFINSKTGWSVSSIIGVSGKIIKTTDGGNSWAIKYETPDRTFLAVYFIDSLKGWVAAVGGTGWVYRTTNGGNSWDSLIVGSGGTIKDVYFINSQTGWVCGPGVHKSTDGGIGWFQQFQQPGGELQSLSFIDSNTGWTTDEVYRVYKTTNSGNNWLPIGDMPFASFAHSIFFSSANTGWISGNFGVMYKTTNGGLNWYLQNTTTTSFLQSVYFVTDSIGWAVGGAGRIIHTTTGGLIVSANIQITNVPYENNLIQNYPNPFNPKTKIKYQIAKSGYVNLRMFDILGREVAVLVNLTQTPGTYEVEFDGSKFPSSIYYYRLITLEFSKTKTMILLK